MAVTNQTKTVIAFAGIAFATPSFVFPDPDPGTGRLILQSQLAGTAATGLPRKV